MRPNILREWLRSGQPTFGTRIHTVWPAVAELLLSDLRRQMLPAYGAMQTDEKSPVYRYAKRAYYIIDKPGP